MAAQGEKREAEPRFVVGIDLGTTHSAIAFSPVRGKGAVRVFPIAQLFAAGEVAEQPLLPSALYHPAEGELPAGATRLPWGEEPWILGSWAKELGAKVPGRLVASAKSWLSHDAVDRQAAILPWGVDDVPKLSPVEASTRILRHLRSAWDAAHPDAPLAAQEVVLTLPASFDEVARELTVQAAREAGLGSFRLLEEPQAAFYDFLSQRGDGIEEVLEGVRLVLVLDVGGGTTDLTLMHVRPGDEEGPVSVERIAVGAHLMLGGDNMDVTLARHIEAKLGQRLDAARWSQLVQVSRQAKEALLAGEGLERYGVSVVGRGARLLSDALRYELEAEEATHILLDGFFPRCDTDELPQRQRSGLAELGLPYASDPAVSRHVVDFLRRHAEVAEAIGAEVVGGLPRPDAILLSGGVFNAPAVRERLSEVTAKWFGEAVPYLPHGSLDQAVARGACAYGQVRRGKGLRISGGSPRSYYVGVEGEGGSRQALCVVPQGMEEGSEREIADRPFSVVVGRPVTFPLFSSTVRWGDRVGELFPEEGLDELPPLHTVLGGQRGEAKEAKVPVRLRAALTELGTLELSLETTEKPRRRWRLEFMLRGEIGGGATLAPIAELPAHFDDAKALVERAYGRKAQPVEAREIKSLWRGLEQAIGPRDGWSSAVNRELWNVVFGGAQRRRRSPDHERVFFQLVGFCLRPGFGAPLDEWRMGELWKLFAPGVQYVTEKANWSEWWVMWRRVAGGLDAGQHRQIFQWLKPWLEPPKGRFPPKPKGPKAEGFEEMLRLLGSLERLSPEEKQEAGRWIFHRLEKGLTRSYWPIGRLGSRQPLFGSLHDVLPAAVAEEWVERLLDLDLRKAEGAAFALAQMARRTGDRGRDLSDALRERVAARLRKSKSAESWVRLVEEGGELTERDRFRVFGDTLPAGLQLG